MKNRRINRFYILFLIFSIFNIYAKNNGKIINVSKKGTYFSPYNISNAINSLPKNQIIPLVNDAVNFSSLTVNGSENCVAF